jgi:F-type H+-transporting ATPase subunit alpha
MKQVAGSLKIELASFRELQAFSQFGSDLDAETKRVLKHGTVLMELLKQAQYDTYPVERQIVELFAAKHGFLDELKVEEVKPALNKLYSHIESSYKEILKEIVSKKVISDSLESQMKEVMKKFFETLK